MNSEDKFVVKIEPMYGKKWVKVYFKDGNYWVPSFEDLWRINLAIAECEDEKYPKGEGRTMVQRFLAASCNPHITWEELRTKYLIPQRKRTGL